MANRNQSVLGRRPLGVRLWFAHVASLASNSSNASRRVLSDCIERSASIRSSTAARPSAPVSCLGLIAAECAGALPFAWPRRCENKPSPICAHASKSPRSTWKLCGASNSRTKLAGRCKRFASLLIAVTSSMPDDSHYMNASIWYGRAMGVPGANRDYVIETVQALEALGYRETDLHRLAARLLSTHQGEAIPVADHD